MAGYWEVIYSQFVCFYNYCSTSIDKYSGPLMIHYIGFEFTSLNVVLTWTFHGHGESQEKLLGDNFSRGAGVEDLEDVINDNVGVTPDEGNVEEEEVLQQ